MIAVPARLYVVQFQGIAVTAQQDFATFTPADDKPIVLLSAHITQSSDYGDSNDEGLSVSIVRGNTTAASGGNSQTPAPLVASDAASGFTSRINDTTKATSGTAVLIWNESFNVRVGFHYVPIPEERSLMSQASTILAVRLNTTPADSLTMDGIFTVAELG